MNRIGYAIVLLFIAVCIVYWIHFMSAPQTATKVSATSLLTPTYRAESITSKLYGVDGVLIHQVSADELNHYDELGFMVFRQPVYEIFIADGTEYTITANTATLYTDNRIVIEDNILLKSLNIDDFIQTIEAAFIELNLETKAVQSDSLIELKGAEFSMLSNGLVGNLANKQFSLVDHVKTEFFVDQSKD